MNEQNQPRYSTGLKGKTSARKWHCVKPGQVWPALGELLRQHTSSYPVLSRGLLLGVPTPPQPKIMAHCQLVLENKRLQMDVANITSASGGYTRKTCIS